MLYIRLYYWLPFTDGETEAYRSYMLAPSRSESVAELELEPRLTCFREHAIML